MFINLAVINKEFRNIKINIFPFISFSVGKIEFSRYKTFKYSLINIKLKMREHKMSEEDSFEELDLEDEDDF